MGKRQLIMVRHELSARFKHLGIPSYLPRLDHSVTFWDWLNLQKPCFLFDNLGLGNFASCRYHSVHSHCSHIIVVTSLSLLEESLLRLVSTIVPTKIVGTQQAAGVIMNVIFIAVVASVVITSVVFDV